MRPTPDFRSRPRRSSASPAAAAAPSGAAAVWSSPAFTRPSNLRTSVRAGAAFHQPPRSQRTQATQGKWQQTHQQSVGGDTRDVDLGAFGRVGDLPLETVDFLLRALEDRRSELLSSPVARTPVDQRRDERRRSSSSRATVSKPRVVDDEHTESSDASDEPLVTTAHASMQAEQRSSVPVAIVRSRSYEALVQLEGILEARHQQLMSDGLLEPPPASASYGGNDAAVSHRSAAGDDRFGYDDEHERGLEEDGGGLEMGDIQEEIRKMHRSLRRQRVEYTADALGGDLDALFARGSS